ncbi:hypothetical protein UP10_09000 [Bradyrhizobium sp. LTSPM299]|uniref:hypothetical protein n=1 Tax=Bradyrhizobium sp. LTSPM299 TaxID=1619233 RepID=UPI0005CAC25D|nr:hypothetical protein [Bradyrhizobium sp. LTSPM299]KJC61041.1 hypothetical protein UP10_09000 [Bradyrhizobium sp. LTSPM299]
MDETFLTTSLRGASRKYLFFDLDINSSQPLISAMQQAATLCFGSEADIDVSAATQRAFQKRLRATADLPCEVTNFGAQLFNDGDMGGMILVDQQQRWVAYQARPIDVGVFAIDCTQDVGALQSVRDCFFSIDDVRGWLLQRAKRERDMVFNAGEGFLAALVENYS